ncbi:hypothetical protein ACFX2J_017732 [Malus domestica]
MSTSEIQDVVPTLDPLINFVDKTTSINLMRQMKNNGLINEKFSNNVLTSKFHELVKDFIATTEFSISQIAHQTHALSKPNLASAKHHTKVLLKASNNFGAESMVQHSTGLKDLIRMGNMDGARQTLEILIEQYDLLKVSLLRYFALENVKLNFSSQQQMNMEVYNACIESQIGLRWSRDQLAASGAEREARQAASLERQAQADAQAAQAAAQAEAEAKMDRKAKKSMAQQAEAAAAAQYRAYRASEAERIRRVATADGPSADPRRKSFGAGPSTALPHLMRSVSSGDSRREITGDNRPPKKGLSSLGCSPNSKCYIM